MSNLYVNGCVRDSSRTDRLARRLLDKLGGDWEELKLESENLLPLTCESLATRTRLLEEGNFDHPMFRYARQFAQADRVVIAAPFWDFSFPALLKTYLEQIYVVGLVSRYSPEGMPVGLCRARNLTYVTTAGGPYLPDFSFSYLKALANTCFGIPNVELVFAENLDIAGNDPEAILEKAMRELDASY